MKKAIIYSCSSDIGYELCIHLHKQGYWVVATYLTYSAKVNNLESMGIETLRCDLSNSDDIDNSVKLFTRNGVKWDLLVLLQATMNPIGRLDTLDFKEWEKSLDLNFTKQIKIIQRLLPYRNINASVITFAGGGTNNATKNYSAYTISKIALIKMMELLYEEYNDTKFTCLGPGWVDTKIHQETFHAKELAYEAYLKTIERYQNNNFTPMEKILECIDWILSEKIEVVSGRNFSIANDLWATDKLVAKLTSDSNMYKLRREGNVWQI